MTWDAIYKILSLVITSGLLGLVAKILVRIGSWQQWGATIDKEVSSHGKMLADQGGLLQRILGRLEGVNGKKKPDS